VVVVRREGRAVGAVWSEDPDGCRVDDESVAGLLRGEWRFRNEQRAWRATSDSAG
jgi:hypothetical protein